MNLREFIYIIKIVWSARKCEDFLWGKLNQQWNLEEWKRMLAKRVHKIIVIETTNPHWKIELQKRLLQNACVSIGMLQEIGHLDRDIQSVPSNLPQYEEKVEKCKQK
jgi:hypothetical protein